VDGNAKQASLALQDIIHSTALIQRGFKKASKLVGPRR